MTFKQAKFSFSYLFLSFFILSSGLSPSSLQAQFEEEDYVIPPMRYEDYSYRNFVRSIRFYLSDSEVDYPIVELNSPAKLILEFDDLQADNKNYNYKIIHCGYDWTPSEEIDPIDYIDGFQENRFYESTNSFNTRTEYLHYQLELPNEDVKWTLSGNYLLVVYIDDDIEDIVLTRRFVVVDTKMKAVSRMRRSAQPPYSRSHQELNLTVEHSGMTIGNPAQDINIAVLQNGRWDNAIMDIDPNFVKNESIIYDLRGQIMFPGNREWRPLDIRSFRHRGPQVKKLDIEDYGFNLLLFKDNPRTHSPYLFTNDLNGKFIISSYDQPAPNERGEYGKIRFRLKQTILPKHHVYVYGGFSEFNAYERHRLTYNDDEEIYEGDIYLKNGFYDYGYLAVNKETGKIEEQFLEGSSFETENDYLFLVYYRPFGGRYDQVVAFQKTSSTLR